ncbi:related to TFIID subunit TAF19 [Rhynchosporium agropyri]|uniref:Transcription initiation factor TFIID subunit 13 n=1 Tax=Rhynchosporium agropyri TaxID=914238 RepID=A0A1E1JX82_9HELO|nr:related to TFIID subunit TAF19 [Rhynchosporium agropyri]
MCKLRLPDESGLHGTSIGLTRLLQGARAILRPKHQHLHLDQLDNPSEAETKTETVTPADFLSDGTLPQEDPFQARIHALLDALGSPQRVPAPLFPQDPYSQFTTAAPKDMEPRARVGKNRGQQNFADQELQHFLFAHGDTPNSLESTKRILDELLTDFITELCFEAHRSAQLSGRQKIKPDDIKFACRKNPEYLGKINETFNKKTQIEEARKLLDQNDDKITKSNVKALEEEPLGDGDDDDFDARNVGGRNNITGR